MNLALLLQADCWRAHVEGCEIVAPRQAPVLEIAPRPRRQLVMTHEAAEEEEEASWIGALSLAKKQLAKEPSLR